MSGFGGLCGGAEQVGVIYVKRWYWLSDDEGVRLGTLGKE
jgi:hypothetical protein